MKIDVGKQAMNGREEDFEGIEFSHQPSKMVRRFMFIQRMNSQRIKKPCGNDSFSFLLGEAIRPYKFGGTFMVQKQQNERLGSQWKSCRK